MCLGFEIGAAGWLMQTEPLSYGPRTCFKSELIACHFAGLLNIGQFNCFAIYNMYVEVARGRPLINNYNNNRYVCAAVAAVRNYNERHFKMTLSNM